LSNTIVPRDLIIACIRHELVSAANINTLLNTSENFSREDDLLTEYSVEVMVNGVSPRNDGVSRLLNYFIGKHNYVFSLGCAIDV